jgi:Glyoxalase-like domain
MAIATFKDLCMDAADPARLGEFWGKVLDLEPHAKDDGDTYLTGATKQHTIWINRVPEPKTVKHRLHLDVNAGSVDEIVGLGATVLDADSFRWTLMADPEGGEFCVFVREGEITRRLYELGLDCGGSADESHRIAAWWAEVLGGHLVDDRGYSYVDRVPGAPYESIVFAPVPEPKVVKNRIHLDVTGSVDDLVGNGAAVLRPRDDEIGWTVLADPDGNEFCAFAG